MSPLLLDDDVHKPVTYLIILDYKFYGHFNLEKIILNFVIKYV